MIAVLPICQHRGDTVEPGVCVCRSNHMRHKRHTAEGVGLVTLDFCAARCWCPNKPQLILPERKVPQTSNLTCPHRTAEPIRSGTCNLCGLKGQPFEIFGCDLHGECSLRKRHSGVKGCAACADRPRPE
jgi:hypothetical protein